MGHQNRCCSEWTFASAFDIRSLAALMRFFFSNLLYALYALKSLSLYSLRWILRKAMALPQSLLAAYCWWNRRSCKDVWTFFQWPGLMERRKITMWQRGALTKPFFVELKIHPIWQEGIAFTCLKRTCAPFVRLTNRYRIYNSVNSSVSNLDNVQTS